MYSQLSEELLRRIRNKGGELILRDSDLNQHTFMNRTNYIQVGPSTQATPINHISITEGPEHLSGYKYSGNKGGYRQATQRNNTDRYIVPNAKPQIHINKPIGTEHLLLHEFTGRFEGGIEYKYIEVGKNIDSLLPTLFTWGLNESGIPTVNTKKPNEVYLFPTNALDWEVIWALGVMDMSHPFLPNFLFTGLIVCVGSYQHIMYEYTDIGGMYGIQHELYISPLKPIELDYPLGFPRNGALEKDKCNQDLIGSYPIEGVLDTDLGTYTGLVTNSTYHPLHKFYVYMRSDLSIFLSSKPPNQTTKDFVLSKREELGLIRDPYALTNPSIPPINIITDGIIKEYIYEQELHEV